MRRMALWQPGLVSYAAGLRLQEEAREEVISGKCDGVLILLEHLPVITVGRSGGSNHLLVSPAWLQQQGIDYYETDRGGDITCHGPGQLVGYPIINLSRWCEDVHWYVNVLEEVLIRTLFCCGLTAGRKAKYTGVWVDNRKIAAIGVSVRRWVTRHGFALNGNNDLSIFSHVVPCGIEDFGVTGVQESGVTVTLNELHIQVVRMFQEIFDCQMERP